jgi:hypothetical protein
MNLRDFVSSALIDIIGGVKDAQAKAPPGSIVPADTAKTFKAVEAGISERQTVDFEVTVKADEHAGHEAKLSVVAAVIGAGVKGETGKSDGHVASLRFRVPVRLPTSSPLA